MMREGTRRAFVWTMVGHRHLTLALVLAIGACAEADTRYGDPNGILGNALPKEDLTSSSDGNSAFGGAFVAGAPATTLRAGHGTDPARPKPDGDVPDCMSCHDTGKTAAGKSFDFGGRLAKKVPAEVVVVGKGGAKIGPVKVDADGFFWSPKSSGVTEGSKVFVRTASATSEMGKELSAAGGGGCDAPSCHGGFQDAVGSGL